MSGFNQLAGDLLALGGKMQVLGPFSADATTIALPEQIIQGNSQRFALLVQCIGAQFVQITAGGSATGTNYFTFQPTALPWLLTFRDMGPLVQLPWFLWGAGPGPASLTWYELIILP